MNNLKVLSHLNIGDVIEIAKLKYGTFNENFSFGVETSEEFYLDLLDTKLVMDRLRENLIKLRELGFTEDTFKIEIKVLEDYKFKIILLSENNINYSNESINIINDISSTITDVFNKKFEFLLDFKDLLSNKEFEKFVNENIEFTFKLYKNENGKLEYVNFVRQLQPTISEQKNTIKIFLKYGIINEIQDVLSASGLYNSINKNQYFFIKFNLNNSNINITDIGR